MNYKESVKILDRIKKSRKIIVNCHRVPDPDSVSGALALYRVLLKMGKDVKVVCPTEVHENFKFLPGFKKIETVDFTKFDFSDFDLFLTLDSSDYYIVTGDKDVSMPDIEVVNIDHHETNTEYGKINLVDISRPSVAEILYQLFADWKVEIEARTATCLLTGVIADSVNFTIPEADEKTHMISAELIRLGADKNKIYLYLNKNIDYRMFKLWGKIIEKMEFDKKNGFTWSAIDNGVYKKSGGTKVVRSWFATRFMQTIEGTDFGIVMVEEEKDQLNVSIRSRTGIDISTLARKLGGGGHKLASGCTIKDMSFDKAVNKVLSETKKFASRS
jgi:phosphoesterase RecJ-like protein